MAREEEVVAKRPEDTARIRSKPAFKYIFNTAFLVLVQGVGFLVLERESRLEGTAGRKRSYPATGYREGKEFLRRALFSNMASTVSFFGLRFSLSFHKEFGFTSQSRCSKPVPLFFLLSVQCHLRS